VETSGSAARTRTNELVLAMTPSERIDLAFSLGEEDLQLFMQRTGLDRNAALRQLRAQRHTGRRPSVAERMAAR
jgi:hypothetical protein